jgi:CheY-like chemotaxis protein
MNSYSILIAEDDYFIAEAIDQIFLDLAINYKIVHSGKEVLEEYQLAYYDMVLLDIMMPDIDGFETASTIRKTNSYIPIIALTSLDFEDIKQEISESGINDYIKKPTGAKELKNLLLHYFTVAA